MEKNQDQIIFECNNLKNALCEFYNLKNITFSNIQDITNLNLAHRNITSVKGLENAQNLQYLDISGNPITDISPIYTIKRLRELIAGENDLTSIDGIQALKNLRTLYLPYNKIEDFTELSKLSKLIDCGIFGNPIKYIFTYEKNETKLNYLNFIRGSNILKEFYPSCHDITLKYIYNPDVDTAKEALAKTPRAIMFMRDLMSENDKYNIFIDIISSKKVGIRYLKEFINVKPLGDETEKFLIKYGGNRAKAVLMEEKLKK